MNKRAFLSFLLVAVSLCALWAWQAQRPAAAWQGAAPHAQAGGTAELPDCERWEVVTNIYIGVQTERLTQEERLAYGEMLPWRQGLRIKNVLPGSPAEQAGLQAGDMILQNNGGLVESMEDLLLSVRNTQPGELIHFYVQRRETGIRETVPVRTAALPHPVVVAYVTLPHSDLPRVEAVEARQRRIAALLCADVPNLNAVREEMLGINSAFPTETRPGRIRLYYGIRGGYITVTVYPDEIAVTLQQETGAQVFTLRNQGDTLPQNICRMLGRSLEP